MLLIQTKKKTCLIWHFLLMFMHTARLKQALNHIWIFYFFLWGHEAVRNVKVFKGEMYLIKVKMSSCFTGVGHVTRDTETLL